MFRHLLWLVILLVLGSGCTDGNDPCERNPTECESDAGPTPDAGTQPDAGSPDAGVEPDSGTPDAGGPLPPFFAKAIETSDWVRPGETRTFLVAAQDPQLSPLRFSWSATFGTVSVGETTSITSEATWTAPACVPFQSDVRFTARVTNGFELSASTHFSAKGLPDCSKWVPTASPYFSHEQHTATLLDSGHVLVVGGPNAIAEVYDPESGTWYDVGSLATARSDLTATRLASGRVLVTGGSNSSLGIIATSEVYDPATLQWSATGSLATARTRHTATLLPSGKVLVVGGSNMGALVTAELYDPETGTWRYTGSLSVARTGHTATLLHSGKVLVAGGAGLSERPTTAELYDLETGTWSTTRSAATGRYYHTATLLDSGKVLLLGGLGPFPIPDGEVYDSETGAWETVGAVVGPNIYDHTATRLPTGTVLVTGGWFDHFRLGGPQTFSQLYDPAKRTWVATGSLSRPLHNHTATLLPSGAVLVVGGRTAELLKP